MIFLDSTYLIGLMIDNDDYHEQAHQLRPIIDKERKLCSGCQYLLYIWLYGWRAWSDLHLRYHKPEDQAFLLRRIATKATFILYAFYVPSFLNHIESTKPSRLYDFTQRFFDSSYRIPDMLTFYMTFCPFFRIRHIESLICLRFIWRFALFPRIRHIESLKCFRFIWRFALFSGFVI